MIPVLAGARAAAESRMLDTCMVTRGGGEGVYDPDSMTIVDAASTPVWSGPCRVKVSNVGVNEVTVGDAALAVTRWEVHVPVEGTGTIAAGDTVKLLSASEDPALVGASFVVSAPFLASQASARRLPVSQVV